jgi:hypothetical protein
MSKDKDYIVVLKGKFTVVYILIVIFTLFWNPVCDGISNFIIPFTKDVPEHLCIALLFISFPLVVAAFNFQSLKTEKKLFVGRYFWELLALAIYVLFKFTNRFDFYSVFGYYFDYFACLFISIVIIELVAFLYRISQKPNFESKLVTPFYLDSPTTKDKYRRIDYIPILLNKIHSTFDKYKDSDEGNSFTILMSEEFGYGKTSFLYQMHDAIEKQYKESFVYIEFKPWMCDTPDAIIKEYFALLQNELGKYVTIPRGLFSSYVGQLIRQSPNNLYTFWIKTFCHQSSLAEEHDEIKHCLAKMDRPIIITIDDVDRLQKEEMRVVLNLIRDTADFRNIFYVIAADKTNLKHSLEKLDVKDTESYLKKFINFELLFPANDNVMKDLFKKHLVNILKKFVNDDDAIKLRNNILGITGISSAFESPRDLYRFMNVFSYALDSVENEEGLKENINYEDLFAISYIQYANPIVYKLLRDRNELILKYDNATRCLCINEKCSDLFCSPSTQQLLERLGHRNKSNDEEKEKNKIQSEDELLIDAIKSKNDIYKEALSFIFKKRNAVDASQMCYEDSYFRYFSFKLKNTQLLGTKVMRILVPNNANFEDNIKEIIKNSQETSFIHILSRNLYTLKEDQLNIYKKVQLFILLFCEMKPEKVNWFSYVGKAREIECAMSAFDLDSLLRSLYYDETKFNNSRRNNDEILHEKYENDKKKLENYILTDTYDINVMSLFLTKAWNHIEHLIFSDTDYEKWSKHIIDSYISKIENMSHDEIYSDDTLYTINHLSQMNHVYFIDRFAKYLNRTELYKDWLAHIVYYTDGKFEFNNRFSIQFNLNNVGEWKDILDKCNRIKKKKICQDLISIIDENLSDVDTKNHPYLKYVQDYWSEHNNGYVLEEPNLS